MSRDPHSVFAVVHRYFTPFALTLVTVALLVSRPAGVYALVSYAVLIFAAVFNVWSERHARIPGRLFTIREARMGVNLAVNSFLVFLLLPFWRPVWLLYVLTPVATGVYESRTKTLQMSAALGALLLIAYSVDGLTSPSELAEAGVHAAFILFLSLFVNRVAHPDAAATIRL